MDAELVMKLCENCNERLGAHECDIGNGHHENWQWLCESCADPYMKEQRT